MPRRDKKIDCPIILSIPHYSVMSGLAELWDMSDPECCRDLAIRSAGSVETVEHLVRYFRKGLCIENKAYIGHYNAEDYRPLFGDTTMGKRVHVKLTYDDWLLISPYQNAMDCPRNHAVALLVVTGLNIVSRETYQKGVSINGVVRL